MIDEETQIKDCKLYKIDKVYGPYVRKDNRKFVVLYSLFTRKRSAKLYSRFLVEINLNTVLDIYDDVHHKDEDITNDVLSNLEVKYYHLHKVEHRQPIIVYVCPVCNTEFVMNYYKSKNNFRNKSGPFCSRQCAGKNNTSVQHYGISYGFAEVVKNK